MEHTYLTQSFILRIHLSLDNLTDIQFFYDTQSTEVLESMSEENQKWIHLIFNLQQAMANYDYKVVLHDKPDSFLTDGENGCIQFIFSDTLGRTNHTKDTGYSVFWNVIDSLAMYRLFSFMEKQNITHLLTKPASKSDIHQELNIADQGVLIYGESKCVFFPLGKMLKIF